MAEMINLKINNIPVSVPAGSTVLEAARAAQEKYIRKFLGKELKVLFEEDGGYSENYIRVYAKDERAKEGNFCRVKLLRAEKDGAFAEIEEVL